MRILLDFECEHCETVKERFVDANTTEVECECGELMRRIISMPTIKLEGITGAFPDAHERWARIREDHARISAKKQE